MKLQLSNFAKGENCETTRPHFSVKVAENSRLLELCRIFNDPVICSYFNSIFRRMGVVNCKVHYTHWLAKKQKKDCWCRVPNCIVCLMTNYGVSMYKIAWSIEAFRFNWAWCMALTLGQFSSQLNTRTKRHLALDEFHECGRRWKKENRSSSSTHRHFSSVSRGPQEQG